MSVAAILSTITKSTGKGMQDAGRYLQGTSSVPSNDKDKEKGLIEKVGDKIQEARAGKGASSGASSAGSGMSSTATGATSAGAGAAGSAGAAFGGSDERLKRVCGDNVDLVELFSKIGSYEFKYTDKARSLYPNGENHVDDKRHVGVMAQELEKNPATNAVINTDNNGYKTVDTVQLTLTNTAVLADVCRRLEALEKQLGI